MSRRPNTSRRVPNGGGIPFVSSFHPKSRPSPILSLVLLVVDAILIIGYIYSVSGGTARNAEALSKLEEVQRAFPILKKAYGNRMRRVLHMTMVATARLLCAKALCVADIRFPLPYRAKSFSLVIVSDALDYLFPKYLNKTLSELARVSADGFFFIFSVLGYPGQHRAKVAELAKFGQIAELILVDKVFLFRPAYKKMKPATKKFEQAATKMLYKPACQVFHLKSSWWKVAN
ncbi:unnamed protein product [Ilex paraguariensis]|uniref:Methyltransferase type 11 domain-containing protein n=1 Tax=Ilex paraguariensis TaxID=185542 RepID=A0ABC8U0I4_9AQUA